MPPSATSFPKDQIKVLLLENVASTALEIFDHQGFQVEFLPPDEVARKIADVHVLGIRSKTHIDKDVSNDVRKAIAALETNIGTRILY